jgi:hypothetical protein
MGGSEDFRDLRISENERFVSMMTLLRIARAVCGLSAGC